MCGYPGYHIPVLGKQRKDLGWEKGGVEKSSM
jgi:hypothetical protein